MSSFEYCTESGVREALIEEINTAFRGAPTAQRVSDFILASDWLAEHVAAAVARAELAADLSAGDAIVRAHNAEHERELLETGWDAAADVYESVADIHELVVNPYRAKATS